MTQSKGYAAHSHTTDLVPWNFERRELGKYDVHIEIAYCGVCQTDYHQLKNDWFPGIFPMVPGHEMTGKVVAIGSEVRKFKTGDLAGVGTQIDSCHTCPECNQHQEQFCNKGPVYTYNSLQKDGTPAYGGYSNNIIVNEEFAFKISPSLDIAGVGPLLCAGITTYSPLRKYKVGKGHQLAVLGMGGLGHLAVKFGVAFGAEVTVLSTSATKESDAKDLGAQHFIVITDADQFAAARNSFDFIIDCVSAPHDINAYLSLLKTNGVHICVGLPAEPFQLSAFSIATGNKTVTGSAAGGLAETQEMLDFCAAHHIISDYELIDIKDINTAFQRMLRGDVRGRFVIDMSTL